MDIKESEKNNINNDINENSEIKAQDIGVETNLEILNKIFKKSLSNKSNFIPILLKSGADELLKIFIEKPNIQDINNLQDFILKKIQLISEIISITKNSPEILYIIFNFLSQKNISIFIYIIDLYTLYISLSKNFLNEETRNNINTLLKEIRKIFSHFISAGLLTQKVIDFIYQKISLFQLQKKLNPNIFNEFIPLLEIIYGVDNDINIKKNLIAKKYFYFYDKEKSFIETSISEKSYIQIKNNFSIVIWFYLKEIEDKNTCDLIVFKNDKGEQINVILNEKNDIDIIYNNNITLNENDNKKYNIKFNTWTQLRVLFDKDGIILYLYQNNDGGETEIKPKYFIKDYLINNKIISNYSLYDCNIVEISFFRNFVGIVGTILFFADQGIKNNKDIEPIDSLFGLQNKNVKDFILNDNIFKGLCFILSPYLFSNNKIQDPISKIYGILPSPDTNNFSMNSIFIFHNYINNIFYLGGCNNFLPLFEIFYKFCEENENKDVTFLKNIFNKLFGILALVFIEKEKNCILALNKEINFFEILGIFMEKIDEKFYYDNEELLNILISIGKNFDMMKISKAINEEESSIFFINVIFNPKIIIKFSLFLLIQYFEKIQKFSVLIPFNKINKLLILLSNKYTNNEIEKSKDFSRVLFDYIKLIFENIDVDDSCRENLFLLYKKTDNKKNDNKNISSYIFINIISIFILYLDINKYLVNDIKKIERRKQTVAYLLNSDNYFIENLLIYLSDTNIHIKKVIINFLRVLTQLYGDLLDQYFAKNKSKKNKRIIKEEFYIFIKENIAPNYYNTKIKEEEINIINDKIFNRNKIIQSQKESKEDIKVSPPIQRSKSISKIKKIKSSEIIQNISNIFSEKPIISLKKRKNSFNKNYQLLLGKGNNLNKKEKKDNNNINIIKKEELTDDQKREIQETKLEIALVLYDWLLSLISEKEKNKDKKNEEIIEESINHAIEYIVKFISYTHELEVIYRILILLNSQKTEKNHKKSDETYKFVYPTLLYYLSSNSLFLQILIECLIYSYIYKNIYKNAKEENDDFIILAQNKEDILKFKLKYFTFIYEKSKELFLDIYFLEKSQKRNEIMAKVLNISLKILIVFQDKNEIQKKNLLLKFLKQYFLDLIEKFNKRNKSIKRYFLNFVNFFVDYSFLLKNSDDFLQKTYERIKDDRTHCLPDFLIFGLIHENEQYQWAGKDIYKKIFHNLKQLFCIKNIFNNFEIVYKDIIKEQEGQKNKLMIFKIDWIKSLINDIVYKKKKTEYYDIRIINALFYTFFAGGYEDNFPIINIISLFNSLNLYLYYDSLNNNENTNNESLLPLLNDIQKYIFFLLIISLLISPKDEFSQSKTYEEIQTLLFKNSYFNIINIKNRLNDEQNKIYYLKILHNIILFLSVLYEIDQKEQQKKKNKGFFKNIFSYNIDISNTAPMMLINFYMKNSDKIFNDESLNSFLDDDKEKGMNFIENNINKNIKENPSFDMYKIEIFQNIAEYRENEITNKLRLLIMSENEFNMNINNYKNIYLKVKGVKNNLSFDEVKDQQQEIFKIKSYRKIKKYLYSYNNSYSNLSVFYNINKEQNPYLLKYKVSDFYSKDMSRKILKPIIDINYYMPNFRKYNYSANKLYNHSNREVYTVDLEIFKNKEKYPIYPDINQKFYKKEYYIEENVCYIKTTNHIKGVLFHLNIEENIDNYYLYFCMSQLPSKEILKAAYDDYDTLNDSCYLSIFRNNMNKKDKDTYLKINFNDINFIFNRKYSFRDNSLEIYTSLHHSYYFKFKTSEKRNEFLNHLIPILNKDSSLFKKLFKPIYSINESGKKITLGYYKDVDNNYEYSNINNIKEMWKNSKISSFEYLMWINIYGNRTFNDISQYPVFPWIITDYLTKNFEDIINKGNIRNFKKPVGLFSLEEKGKERVQGYIDTYKFMSLELKDDEVINFKILSNEIKKKEDNKEIKTENNEINNEYNDSINENIIKIKDNIYPEIPQYSFNIEKMYKNLSIEYEKIPYLFGSHYSNGMYVCHFMGRIFPYCLTMIEIQGAGFDCSERLFICLQKTFSSASNEKCDVRELIPEFYCMPELLLNINKLNLGDIKIDNYFGSINYYDEFFEKNQKNDKIAVGDVLLPEWCKDNPYLFIIKKKELLENCLLDINSWIDLIFGYYQRGTPAQQIGNLFSPYCYDGVMDYRLNEDEFLKNREELEYKMRLFELGVNPTKVFDKKILDKKKILRQITDIKGEISQTFPSFNAKDINYIANINNNFNNIFLFSKKYSLYKSTIEEKNNLTGDYKIKEAENYEQISKILLYDKTYKLIIKTLIKSNNVLFAGFYSDNVYLFSLEKISKLDKMNSTIYSMLNNNEKKLLNIFGKGIITTLEVSQDEKYIIWGNIKGSLIILELYTNQNKENNIKLLKIISSHSGYSINYISINSDLNLFADCSYDNYIHIYSLPKCDKIFSLYNKYSDFYLDFIFLSAQPLASIILYSKQNSEFKCYNINGSDLNVEKTDKDLINNELKNKIKNDENMISPIIFTDWNFNDYLIYIIGYRFILLRKAPLMDLIFKISFNENENINMICLSPLKDSIYALDTNKKVIIIQYDKCKKIIKNNKNSIIENNKDKDNEKEEKK